MSLLQEVSGIEPPADALSESLPCWAVSRGATVTQPPPWPCPHESTHYARTFKRTEGGTCLSSLARNSAM